MEKQADKYDGQNGQKTDRHTAVGQAYRLVSRHRQRYEDKQREGKTEIGSETKGGQCFRRRELQRSIGMMERRFD